MDRYEFPNRKGAKPIRGITFKEAAMMCKSMGKTIPNSIQFRQACEGSTDNTYPYGKEFIEGKCRMGLNWTDGPAPSGSYPECVSEFGVYDITGNVWEWLKPVRRGIQHIGGGAWNSGLDRLDCNSNMPLNGLAQPLNVGFRCILAPEEKSRQKKARQPGKKRPPR